MWRKKRVVSGKICASCSEKGQTPSQGGAVGRKLIFESNRRPATIACVTLLLFVRKYQIQRSGKKQIMHPA